MAAGEQYRAMVATAHPLATRIGADVLRQGGNCVDAAIAVAAALNVVDMSNTGIGGDAFALMYSKKDNRVVGLNASGRAPFDASIELYRKRGLSAIPERGPLSVTTPGALSGWVALHERYGTMSFGELLKPAIALAKDGFPINHAISIFIGLNADVLRRFPESAAVYLKPDGTPPEAGDTLCQKALGESLERVAEGGATALYGGPLGKQIAAFHRKAGGLLTEKDFIEHRAEWVDPIKTHYRGYTVITVPPNSQGIILLEMLNIMEGYDSISLRENPVDLIHCQVEAKKVAFKDRARYVCDPMFFEIPVKNLLSRQYAAMMRTHINPKKAADAASDIHERGGDTTYFCVVDYEGNAVSFINSLFHPFGSGMVAGDTGIVLQNRGLGFSFEPGHPNSLQSHKRPMHTLIPCMVFRDSRPVLILGCIGGDQQPQGLLQILMNIIDFGMSPQDAIDAPRWRSYEDGSLIAESALGAKVVQDLSARGHRVLDELDFFGGSQCIMFNDDGILRGGSDPRLAGCWQGLP